MDSSIEIRPAGASDGQAIVELAVTMGLLTSEEANDMVSAASTRTHDAVDWLVAVTDTGAIAGATYSAREPVSDQVWNLYFMAVAPGYQGTGVGTALVKAVEVRLRSRSADPATALVIETSDLEAFAPARALYTRCGYASVGHVPDYYEPGDGKIIFWKTLT